MKRTVCMLIVILIAFAICSCAATDNEEFLVDFNSGFDSGKIDFGGFECTIMQNHMAETTATSLFSYPSGTLMEDMLLQRKKEIENDVNCKITIKTDGTIRLDSIVPVLASGSFVADILFTSGQQSFVRAGFCFPLDAMTDYLDYTDSSKYGGYGMLEPGLFKGTVYSVSPIMWPGKQIVTSFGVFVVNENLISRYGRVDPRDYVENGEWTWDTFEKVIPDYQIDDGSVQATAVNITWGLLEFAMMNGMQYYTIQDDGSVLPAIDSPEVAETLDWCSRLFANNKDYITFNDHETMLAKMLNDELVMSKTAVDHIIRFMSYKLDNFGVVPMPCGPHGTYGEWTNAYHENIAFMILYNTLEEKCAATVIDRFCDPFEGYETEDDLKNYMSNIFFDDRDLDVIMSLFRNTRWAYQSVTSIYDFFNNAATATANGKSSAEILSSQAERVNETIIKEVIPNVEFIESLKSSNGN